MIDLRNMSRLKKIAWHDVSDRDCALAYIDGEIVEAETHAECVSIYLEDEFNLSLNEEQIRPNINIEVDDAWDDSQAQDLQNIYDNIKQICFGHIDKTNKVIYLEPEGLNVTVNDLSTIGQAIKGKYSDYKILIDNASNSDFEQVARLKKKAEHDTMNRDCAIVYINGEFYQGNTHAEAINQYLNNSGKKLNETKYRPFFNVEPKSYYSDKDIEDINTMNDTEFKEVAFAHEVKDENAIYIEQYSLQNIDIETAAKLFKEQYPSFNIYNDDKYDKDSEEYQLIAKLKKSRLKKIAEYFDKGNRDCAIVFINGEFIEADEHWNALKEYFLKEYGLDANKASDEEIIDNIMNGKDDVKLENYAMASKKDNCIYIMYESVEGITIQELIQKIETQYPDYKIDINSSFYDDDELKKELAS
jgi:hypothetical protein